MRLTDDLRAAAQRETSLFQAQLLKEDVARLERLEELARRTPDRAAFLKAAKVLGWTQGDLRSFELDPELSAFVEAVHGLAGGGDESLVLTCWDALHRCRMSLLVGCLSRPRIEDL